MIKENQATRRLYLVLSNNTIIIKKSGSSGEITDVDGLQAAIDAASVGSIDNPTLITINKSFAITKTILIKKKHIKLTGETLTAGVTTANYCRMFDVMDGGALILEKLLWMVSLAVIVLLPG